MKTGENTMDIKLHEKKVYQSFHKDGTLDLIAGNVLLYFGLTLLAGRLGLSDLMGVLAAFIPAILLIATTRLIKQKITVPRMGTTVFSDQRQKKIKSIIILPLATIIIGLISYFVLPNKSTGLLTTMLFGSVFLIVYSVAAYLMSAPRLSIYGILATLAFVIGKTLEKSETFKFAMPILMLFVFTITFIVGVTMLIKFIKTHPIIDMGDHNE
jgi:hypothetical protein